MQSNQNFHHQGSKRWRLSPSPQIIKHLQQLNLGIFVMCTAMLVIIWQTPSVPVQAMPIQHLLEWQDLSPDVAGSPSASDPDYSANTAVASENDTYMSPSGHIDPFHGLATASGGVSPGFTSETFTNTDNSGIDLTIYVSDNQFDGGSGTTLQTPDFYGPITCNLSQCGSESPDRHVLGEWNLRVTRDNSVAGDTNTRTPTTVVLSFSDTVFLNEFIIGSLSRVSNNYEHAIVRAFATTDATGAIVKASDFLNISDLTDDSTLLLTGLGDLTEPATTNNLNNIIVDADLNHIGGGLYDNVGDAADDGVYHVYGSGNQGANNYGRAKWVYGDTAIQSIAISFFPTSRFDPDPPFDDTDYTTQWVSAVFSAITLTPENPLAVSLQNTSTSQTSTPMTIFLVAIIVLSVATSVYLSKKQRVELS